MSQLVPPDDQDDADRELLDRRARLLSVPPDAGTAATEPHLVIGLAGHRFAVPAVGVRLVCDPQAVTAVPGAPPGLQGIVSVMGDLVPVADLGTLLAVPSARSDGGRLVVVDDGDEALGLLVDAVDDVVALDTHGLSDGARHVAPGSIIGPPVDGVRVLSLDGLLTDVRLSPT